MTREATLSVHDFMIWGFAQSAGRICKHSFLVSFARPITIANVETKITAGVAWSSSCAIKSLWTFRNGSQAEESWDTDADLLIQVVTDEGGKLAHPRTQHSRNKVQLLFRA